MPTIRVRLSKWLGGQFAVTSRVYALCGSFHLTLAIASMAMPAQSRAHASVQILSFAINVGAAMRWLRRVIHERSYEAGLLVGKAHNPTHRVYVVDAPTFRRMAEFPPSAFIPRDQ